MVALESEKTVLAEKLEDTKVKARESLRASSERCGMDVMMHRRSDCTLTMSHNSLKQMGEELQGLKTETSKYAATANELGRTMADFSSLKEQLKTAIQGVALRGSESAQF